jgi:imidazolonepropionase-like amidohydrolase
MNLAKLGDGIDSGFCRPDLTRRSKCISLLLIAMIALLIVVSWTAPVFAAETIAVVAAHLIDGSSDQVRHDVAIVIEDDRIVAIGDVEIIPAGARVIDLGPATILPGLIDTHVHPLIREDEYQTDHLRESSAAKALRGLKAVQDSLRAGWTSLRIVGDTDVFYAPVEIRRAIDEGLFEGPRLAVAPHYLSITGGGGDINFYSPEQHLIADGLIVDGVDEVRRAVREEIKYGGDWIKLLVTGAFMSAGDNPRDVHFSPEELEVAVTEASRLRVPVMAHAHSAEAVKQAVRAGVCSIEHGTFIDAEGIRLMVEHGTYLVPTVYIGDYYIEERPNAEAQQKMVELSKRYRDEFLANIGAAIRARVKIAVGSDFGGYDPLINAREFASLVEAGMTPMQAIQAGTRVGAVLLEWEDRVGTIEAGNLADIIAVSGDPFEDLSELERVIFVMKGGAVVKAP